MHNLLRNINARNIAYLYILLPIIIFMLGWMKPYFGIPCTIVVIAAFLRMCRDKFDQRIHWNIENILSFLSCLILIFVIVIFSGIGGLTYQNLDHLFRNEIYEVLVKYDWPVYFSKTTGNHTARIGLCYYIGFWLPAAIVGKLFGVSAGYLFQILYAVIGLALVAYFFFAYFKKVSFWQLLSFFFFSGLDIVGYLITHNGAAPMFIGHPDWWVEIFEYSSFTAQLFWVYNQAIFAWLVTQLLFMQENNRYVLFILSSLLLTGTLPCAGLFPYIIYIVAKNISKCQGKTLSIELREILSIDNILGGGVIGVVSSLYLFSNNAVSASSSIFALHNRREFILYIAFILLEVGIYLLIIYNKKYKSKLYWLTAAILCIYPLIQIGEGHDFCMRASIPALLILYVMVFDTLQEYRTEHNYLKFATLAVILSIGAITPAMEFNRTIYTEFSFNQYTSYDKFKGTTKDGEQELFMIDKRECASDNDLIKNINFTCDINKNAFYKYLSR